MEYLALVYGNPDSWDAMSESERAAAYKRYMAVARDAEAAGALVAISVPRRSGLQSSSAS